MKAAAITTYGSLDALTILDLPVPTASPHEALIAVVSSTINPVDVKTRLPDTPQEVSTFPAVLGWDLAGVVVTAPPESAWRPGDRVIAMHPPQPTGHGCWQQYVTIDPNLLAAAPTNVDLITAATLPLAALTADQALQRLNLRKGERLLVTGAVGSVGGMAVQLATHSGISVTVLVSRPEHQTTAISLGATAAHSELDSAHEFDAIFDTAGILGQPRLLKPGGKLVTVSDDRIPNALAERARIADHNYVHHDPQRLGELSTLVTTGALRLRVAHHYPLSDIQNAHRTVEAGGLDGKVVISV